MNLQLSIHGFLVGHIWMPAAECYKPLAYDITAEDERFSESLTLREHVLRATNDGDFQSGAIADGYIKATVTKLQGASVVKRTRCFPLNRFPSIEDCRKDDWEGPMGEDLDAP